MAMHPQSPYKELYPIHSAAVYASYIHTKLYVLEITKKDIMSLYFYNIRYMTKNKAKQEKRESNPQSLVLFPLFFNKIQERRKGIT